MSPSFLRAAALAAAAWLPAFGAGALPLTLDQALDLAVQRSQAARSARAGAHSAAEMARTANQQPDPMLSLGIENLPATGPDRFSTTAEGMTMKRVALAQEWLSADKRAARERVAGAMAGREALMERIAAGEARLQTALAYLDTHFASAALKLTADNEHHAMQELEAGKGRLASATSSSAEVLALASALGVAEDESAEQRQQQAAAAQALKRWTGLPADDLAEPALVGIPPLEDYLAAHPQLVARQRDVELARQEAELTRLGRQPNWTWEVSWGQRQRMADLLTLGVSIPLPVAPADRQDRETAAKLALVDKALAEQAEALRAAEGEYAALASDAKRLGERIERLQVAVLQPLRLRSEATLAAYRANQASLVMLFEARHAELEAQRRLLGLRKELARARAQLIYRPLPILDTPAPPLAPTPSAPPAPAATTNPGAAP